MQQSFDVFFVSSNRHKYEEAKKILENFGINIGFLKYELEEIQADSIKQVAARKVLDAYQKCKKPVIIEDDGLFIDSLGGFPGPYSSFVFKTLGNKGILKLVSTKRAAKFESVISFHDKKHGSKFFEASISGKISKKLMGKGWGYDPIFVPEGKNKTYAQINDKNEISHRYKALRKFASWFYKQQASGQ